MPVSRSLSSSRRHRFRTPFRTRAHLLGLAALMLAVSAPLPALADEVELEGTWYVLVHYTDSATANADATRWLDLVWVFEKKSSRLEWQQYPMVVFEDASGRFEAIPGNPRARTLHAWEPNDGQRRVIDGGPRVNQRGAKVKTLRGSHEKGWKTVDRMTATASASVLSYQEKLRIEQPLTLPRFVRADSLGSSVQSSSGGETVFETTEVRSGGRKLVGRYTRDGHQEGTFKAWRTEPVRGLPEKEGTPNERLVERMREAGGVGAMGLGQSSGGPREGFDEGDDF